MPPPCTQPVALLDGPLIDGTPCTQPVAMLDAHRDMTKGTRFNVFRYTKYYHRMAGAELALDLLNDPAVQSVLQVGSKSGGHSHCLDACQHPCTHAGDA